jgi:hypothetical protein
MEIKGFGPLENEFDFSFKDNLNPSQRKVSIIHGGREYLIVFSTIEEVFEDEGHKVKLEEEEVFFLVNDLIIDSNGEVEDKVEIYKAYCG